MIQIGFLQDSYEVNEVTGTAIVQFGVLGTGILDHQIIVDFDFTSGTAQGKNHTCIYSTLCGIQSLYGNHDCRGKWPRFYWC